MQNIPDGMKLNVGCGRFPCAGTDWINVDASEGVETFMGRLGGEYHFRRAAGHDMPFIEDGSVKLVYSSHLIEHYPRESAAGVYGASVLTLLAEWRRVLCEGGEVWIATPDLLEVANRVMSEPGHREDWLRILFGHQASEHDHHLWLYDRQQLGALLVDSGFWPCGQFSTFVCNPDGEGMDCAGGWCSDDWGEQCPFSLRIRARRRGDMAERQVTFDTATVPVDAEGRAFDPEGDNL